MHPSVFPLTNPNVARAFRNLTDAFKAEGDQRYRQLRSAKTDLYIFTNITLNPLNQDQALFFYNTSSLINCFYGFWHQAETYRLLSQAAVPENYLSKIICAFIAYHEWEKCWTLQDEVYDETDSNRLTDSTIPTAFRTALSASIAGIEEMKLFYQQNLSDIPFEQTNFDTFLLYCLIQITQDNFVRHQRTCDILLKTSWPQRKNVPFPANFEWVLDQYINTNRELLSKLG